MNSSDSYALTYWVLQRM